MSGVPMQASAGAADASATVRPPSSGTLSSATKHSSASGSQTFQASTVTAPMLLQRDRQPWTQAKVDALLAAGTLKASWLPDIRAVAPEMLQLQREHQRDVLRFSNSIANTGLNHLQVRRGVRLDDSSDPNHELRDYATSLGLDISELAVTTQDLLDENGSIAAVVSDAALSEFHPSHRHFHIGETTGFSIQRLNSDGKTWDPLTGYEVKKVTFCLIDVNQIQPAGGSDPNQYETIKSPTRGKVYNDCYGEIQGVQAGWMDRYHHSLPGQEVDITSLPVGTYRLFVTVNPSRWFLESDYSNNSASVGFSLDRNKQGQAFIQELPQFTSGVWFAQSSNGIG